MLNLDGAVVVAWRGLTMTITHSYEVSNVNQEPGPTDMSAGVMTHTKRI